MLEAFSRQCEHLCSQQPSEREGLVGKSMNIKNSSNINACFLLQEKVDALRAVSATQLCRRGQSVCTVQRNQARLLQNFTTTWFTVSGRNAFSTGHSPSKAAVLMALFVRSTSCINCNGSALGDAIPHRVLLPLIKANDAEQHCQRKFVTVLS